MKAVLNGVTIAESDDIVECDGHRYFPAPAVRTDLLQKSARTGDDLECPHGVQFYDLVIGGERHARRAWRYEAPLPKMRHVAGRFSFWEDVEVG
ncbi:MAG: DUF427 domain-containing protein [Rhodospirillales bacterium]